MEPSEVVVEPRAWFWVRGVLGEVARQVQLGSTAVAVVGGGTVVGVVGVVAVVVGVEAAAEVGRWADSKAQARLSSAAYSHSYSRYCSQSA